MASTLNKFFIYFKIVEGYFCLFPFPFQLSFPPSCSYILRNERNSEHLLVVFRAFHLSILPDDCIQVTGRAEKLVLEVSI